MISRQWLKLRSVLLSIHPRSSHQQHSHRRQFQRNDRSRNSGMDRLLIKQTGSKVNGSAKRPSKCPPVAAELTQRSRQEAASESPKVGKQSVAEVGKQPVEVAADQNIPSLSSPMWQPASKRVLDAVCVTDVTAGSGVTITVRESSVIDGFFRSRAE